MIAIIAVLIALLLAGRPGGAEAARRRAVRQQPQATRPRAITRRPQRAVSLRHGPREHRAELLLLSLWLLRRQQPVRSDAAAAFEQQSLANAYNYSLINWVADNTSVSPRGLSALWCPSDGAIAGLRNTFAGWGWDGSTQTLVYISYAGNMGTFTKVPITITSPSQHLAVLNQANGVFFYLGYPAWNPALSPNPIAPRNPGSIRPASLSSVTNGLGNTFAFGEKAHGKFSQKADVYYSIDYQYNGAWVSGNFGDTLFTAALIR